MKRIVLEENPVIFACVETKLNKEDKVEIPGFEISRVDRVEDGGGVMLVYRKCLKKIMVETKEIRLHNAEMLWKKLNNGKVKIVIGVIYMPQESRTKIDKLKEIYQVIEEQIADTRSRGESILILGDLNCKVGKEIAGNTHEVTCGGKMLLKLTKKYKMKIVNADPCCEGLWTRIEGQERSVLDYAIMFEEDAGLLQNMKIDEEKDITPYYVDTGNGIDARKYTDHCMVKVNLNIQLQADVGMTYSMILDKEGCDKFRERLEKENVSDLLNGNNIQETYSIWNKKVLQIRESCCKRVKIRKSWKVCRMLTKIKKSITREMKNTDDKEKILELKRRRDMVKHQIEEEEEVKEYTRINKIVEEIKKDGGVHSNTFWKVRRKISGKEAETAHSMMNKNGNMCETPEEIKKIYTDWYQELLKTSQGESKIEKEAEEVIDQVWKSMVSLANNKPPIVTKFEEVKEVVKNLDLKKAKDTESWKNNIIIAGGDEMIRSLTSITNQVDKQKIIPKEWENMEIKAIHKAGPKYRMENKRGLFLTNNVSKVYEKIVKNRNAENFKEEISEWQTGGVANRATVDNVMIATAIMEQNRYLKTNTYLVLTDAEKCFDKLWLMDGVCELWRCGTDVRDCVMIKKLNEKANIVVKTPVGNTDPFTMTDIVRQGSVYGPQICIASMDKINFIGRDAGTHYGPDLLVRSVVFVDDVSGLGKIQMANNLIYNCSLMEERKKMTFGNKQGKTEYMIVGKFNEEIRTVSKKVKKGIINRVNEHKMLGTWFDETGDYGINTNKRKKKMPFMISTVRKQANPRTVGSYTVAARLNLAEIVVIRSFMYNIEAFPVITSKEVKELESVQLSILTNCLELPLSTPYYALLMEVGWWTMEGRIAYVKLMLYHNIMRSNKRRVLKNLLKEQEKEERETTWLAGIKREMKRYNIKLKVEDTLKSNWKREVKKKINEVMEKEIRQKCFNSKKARFVREDQYERKEYLRNGNSSLTAAKAILRARLNMCNLPGNYKSGGDGLCNLCEEGEGSTEHYLNDCNQAQILRKAWGVNMESVHSQEKSDMEDLANFLKKIEIMIDPGRKNFNSV